MGFDAATCDYLCDGTADEVQINLAIAAVVALGGGCVALQRGTYNLAAPVVMDSEVWLHGSGFDTVLTHPAAGGFDMIPVTGKINMIISDMFLEGTALATCGIYFNGCTYSIIQRVYVNHINDEGIKIDTTSSYNKILDNIVTNCHDQGIYVGAGNYNSVIGNFCYANSTQGIYVSGTFTIVSCNIVYYGGKGAISIVGADSVVVSNLLAYNAQTDVGYDLQIAAARCSATGNYCLYNQRSKAVYVTAANAAIVNNVVFQCADEGISIEANDCSVVGNSVARTKFGGLIVRNCSRCSVVGNHVDSPDSASANLYDGIMLLSANDCTLVGNSVTNSAAFNVRQGIRILGLGGSSDNVVMCNRVRGYDIGINIGADSNRNLVKDNILLDNTVCFQNLGTDTKLASVIVSFVGGTDPQDSGFLVDSTNGGDDFARAYTMLPVEVQQVVRAKVYARSVVAEVHSMEADFTIYGAADNEAYTTHNGSAASLGSTSVNFAADDVVYWTLTAAGLLAMLGKDSVEVKVDYAAADGDNCATNAYFRTVEIEYV